MLNTFAAWLSTTPLTAFLENAAWAVPTIQTVHILCIAVVFGGAVFVDLRVFGVIETGQPISAILDRHLPAMGVALAVLALTGGLLIASEPNRAIFRTVFWIKMALIAAAFAVTWAQARIARTGHALSEDGRAVPFYRLLAGASLALWIGVIFAGRWIGYVSGWPGSPT
ncbi:MAG: hypothetical protein JO303_09425 [Caulobacteraceae bacterium]|nr:hypothetical protein [Caulobacteraceae bacterium]